MKKFVSCLLVFMLLFSCMIQSSAADVTYIYVSTDGNDANAGTLEQPVATLNKAAEMAASGNTVIYMMGGTYPVTDTVLLDHAKNVTVRAYNGQEVILTAAQKIDNSLFQKVTDPAVLDRIVDRKAKEKIVSVNLAQAGITNFGEIPMAGFGYPGTAQAPQLLVNGKMQTVARYPDDEYLGIYEVVDEGVDVRNNTEGKGVLDYKGQGIAIRTSDARVSKWRQAKDVYMFGYFMYDWAEAVLPCTINFEERNTVSTEYPSVYGVAKDRRFYFFNLLEEISKPGEWYLDRETGILYTYPETELNADTVVEYITFSKPFLSMDGAEQVTIEDLRFAKGLDMGMKITNSNQITVTDCTFDSISSTVISMNSCYDSTISYCNFNEIGGTAIDVKAGDIETLKPGNCLVTNCVIDGFQKIKPTGAPGISLFGVGNVASHNEISDGANIAIWFGGNNHVVEYNDISNVCTDTADAGAIYAGREWSSRGNEVRYNYIHDMVKIDNPTSQHVQAIYLDDGFSSANVHGNIIQNVPSIALFGGGRYNVFENNIILDCKEPFVYDQRYLTWDQTEIRNKLNAIPYTNEIWKEAYPELQGILEDEPGSPKYSIIRNNISMNSPGYFLSNQMLQYALEVEEDYLITENDFVDYAKGNLNLKETSSVFKNVPEFKAIDFNSIGVQEKPSSDAKTEEVLKQSVVLLLEQPKTFVFGQESMVDPDNTAVYPFTEHDRTLVPVRFIAESFGGEVSWEEATQKVGITYGDNVIELTIDDVNMTVNGKAVVLDVPAKTKNDRTMLPLRAVVEALGKTVHWDERGLIVISDDAVIEEGDMEMVDAILNLF